MPDIQSNPKLADGGGLRFDDGKPRIELVPPIAVRAIAEVLGFGAKKYGDNNWCRGMQFSKCYAPCMRHLLKWWEGKENDDESGLPHLYHALCNIAMLIVYQAQGIGTDDRMKPLPKALEPGAVVPASNEELVRQMAQELRRDAERTWLRPQEPPK